MANTLCQLLLESGSLELQKPGENKGKSIYSNSLQTANLFIQKISPSSRVLCLLPGNVCLSRKMNKCKIYFVEKFLVHSYSVVMFAWNVFSWKFLNWKTKKKSWKIETRSAYRKELHGWITQWPAVFCLIRSFTSAFLLPKSFMASRLSVGWNHACNWFLRKFDDGLSAITGRLGSASSFGVP